MGTQPAERTTIISVGIFQWAPTVVRTNNAGNHPYGTQSTLGNCDTRGTHPWALGTVGHCKRTYPWAPTAPQGVQQ
jgi:hypothetical protein